MSLSTNDPLKARLSAAMEPLTSADEIVPRIVFDSELGPLAGHVLLDLLEENGAGPEEAQVVVAVGEGSGLLAMQVQVMAAARGLGYHVALGHVPDPASPELPIIGEERLDGADVVIDDTGATPNDFLTRLAWRLYNANANTLAIAILGWPGYVGSFGGADEDIDAPIPLYVAIEKDVYGA